MSKKVFTVLGGLAVIASVAMYMVGKNSSHLSELGEFWWAPLPLALIFLVLGARK